MAALVVWRRDGPARPVALEWNGPDFWVRRRSRPRLATRRVELRLPGAHHRHGRAGARAIAKVVQCEQPQEVNMARSILVFAVVICALVCALNSGEAQPPSLDGLPDDLENALIAAPPSTPAPRLVPTLALPASTPYGAPAYRPNEYSHDEIQSLKQQFITLAQKSAERMDAPELKQSIAEMRRLNVISELKLLAD